MLRCVTLATAAALLPVYSRAFVSSTYPVAGASLRTASRYTSHHLFKPQAAFVAPFSSNLRRKRTGVAPAASRGSRKTSAMVMGVEVVPLLGGLEAAAALFAGHLPGVFVGALTVLWTTVLKTPVNESLGSLKPIGSTFGGFLTFLTVTMLGVRTFTAGPDTRYLGGFPSDIAHPEGCTRVASEGGNKGIAVPTFKASVEEVQAVAKDWLESQPRTRIETDNPGYLHAKSLSRLFGFPDSIAVKIFKNGKGKTEVWVQSELRVGQSDLDVNLNRMKAFLGHLGAKLT